MSAESDFYALLSGSAGVTALVGTRIYPDVMPEERALPAIVFARLRTEPIYLISGAQIAQEVDISVGCWAESRASADAIADAVQTALIGSEFVVRAREAAFDAETGLLASLLSATILDT